MAIFAIYRVCSPSSMFASWCMLGSWFSVWDDFPDEPPPAPHGKIDVGVVL